ncbi:hypothetical protein H0D82_000406 [Salmonella enterica]|nr:hypothetical protein [Salmonella enterica]
MIFITSKREGFARCGVRFSETTTPYPDDRFTPEQLAELEAEPMLVVSRESAGMTTTQATEQISRLKDALDTAEHEVAVVTAERDVLHHQLTPPGANRPAAPGYHAPGTSVSIPDVSGPAPVMSAWRESTAMLNRIISLPDAMLRHEVSGSVPLPENAIHTDMRELVTLHKTLAARQAAELAAMLFMDDDHVAGLSQQDLESVANDVRGFIQTAITGTRENYREATARLSEDAQPLGLLWRPVVEDLKASAYTVQVMAEAIMATRPPLTWRTVRQDGNLHLLAHTWYQDYTRAAELLRLNPQIRDPNDIRRGDVISAYAR